MQSAGYLALKRAYDLFDIPHHVTSYIVRGARRTVDTQEFYPPVYQPEDSLAGQLEFALKYEGINLTILRSVRSHLAQVRHFTDEARFMRAFSFADGAGAGKKHQHNDLNFNSSHATCFYNLLQHLRFCPTILTQPCFGLYASMRHGGG